MRNANDAIRFLLELALLAALTYAGGTVGSAAWLQIVLAIAGGAALCPRILT
jgi:Protein of unknown function (DUF2568)